MEDLSRFFNDNIVAVFFLHGLALFVMGALITLESQRSRPSTISRSLAPLGYFGLLASVAVWLEMFAAVPRSAQGPNVGELLHQIQPSNCLQCHQGPGQTEYIQAMAGSQIWDGLQLVVFIAAGLFLVWFGVRVFRASEARNGKALGHMALLPLGVWSVAAVWAAANGHSWEAWLGLAHIFGRYFLYLPGTLLAAVGLWRLRNGLRTMDLPKTGTKARWAASLMLLDSVFDGLIVAPAEFLPAAVINHASFFQSTGVPVQLFRALLAGGVAYLVVQVLREVDNEQGRRINEMLSKQLRAQEDAREMESQRRVIVEHEKQLRGEVLKQVIAAQEDERKRVARELHDEMGQTLTGLATGLEACISALDHNKELARMQLEQLRSFAERAVDDVHRLIADLRPAMLDDLGLVSALRWYANAAAQQGGFQVRVVAKPLPNRLPAYMESVLFRIAQEALTNVIRHAGAKEVTITLECDDEVWLEVADDGQGFDAQQALDGANGRRAMGLLGMRERALLAGGVLEIISQYGEGCRVVARLPYEREGSETGELL